MAQPAHTPIEFAEECFGKYKNLNAFHFMGKNLSYHELDQKSKNFAAYLHSRGLKPGDKIALMMPNMLQYPVAIFGALRAGLVIVNTNPLYTPHEMEYQFNDSGVKAIVIAENFAANLEKILANTQIQIVITTTIGEFLGGFKGRNDVILLQYTGGTTGVSKGTMLTNRNLVANLQQIRAILGPYLKVGQETTLSPLPMYHIFAFAVNVLAMMAIGAKTVLIVNAREIGTVAKAFKDHKISLMTGVNT